MICNCGGTTNERTVIENKIVVCVYLRCISCGRVLILPNKLKKENENE